MSKYLIVYDNNCGVCNTGVKILSKTGVINFENRVQLSALQQNNITCNVIPQKACDELAVVNKESLEVQYGAKGLALVLAEKLPFFSAIILHKFSIQLVHPLYVLVASNRRIIAPLNIEKSSCKPTLKKGYRIALLVLVALVAIVVTYIKGEIIQSDPNFSFINGPKLIQITGLGWVLHAVTFKGNAKWDYWGHLAIIVLAAMIVQTTALIGYQFTPHIIWIFGSMLLSEMFMIYLHIQRITILKLPKSLTLKWWLVLHLSASVSVLQYYFS